MTVLLIIATLSGSPNSIVTMHDFRYPEACERAKAFVLEAGRNLKAKCVGPSRNR